MGIEQTPQNIDLFDLLEPPYKPYEFTDDYEDHPQDECGVYGVYTEDVQVMPTIFYGLKKLQHRGQSAAGVAYPDTRTGEIEVYSGIGRVYEAIPMPKPIGGMTSYDGSRATMAIGHVLYTTAELTRPQPAKAEDFAVAMNGDIEDIDQICLDFGMIPEIGDSDTYKITKLLAHAKEQTGDLMSAIKSVLPSIEGAYSMTIVHNDSIIGIRDPWGFRPLVLGKIPYSDSGYVLASEESAFRATGAKYQRDVKPGEIVVINEDGLNSSFIDRKEETKECMYEYIYLARPWETQNDVVVYEARKNMGMFLAEDYPVDADVVVAVPNSGRSAAAGYSQKSGLPNVEGIFVEDGAGRTFILREGAREELINDKYIINDQEVAGKRIVLVDDSVIKGNTMRDLIEKLKNEGGALEVHVMSAAPRYQYSCYMGMDTRDTNRLIAHNRTDEEIAAEIGADSIHFNTVSRAKQSIDEARIGKKVGLCDACATGNYPFKKGTFADKLGGLATLQFEDEPLIKLDEEFAVIPDINGSQL